MARQGEGGIGKAMRVIGGAGKARPRKLAMDIKVGYG